MVVADTRQDMAPWRRAEVGRLRLAMAAWRAQSPAAYDSQGVAHVRQCFAVDRYQTPAEFTSLSTPLKALLHTLWQSIVLLLSQRRRRTPMGTNPIAVTAV
jgi:hypothetical protein